MTRRILIVLAFLATFSSGILAQAPSNCSTGTVPPSGVYGDNWYAPSCPSSPSMPTTLNGTTTRTVTEQCQATMGAQMAPGTVYWVATPPSVEVGNGQRHCYIQPGGDPPVDCKPRMNYYEVDGGQFYPPPNNTQSDTYYNRFFNQSYDHAWSYLSVGCYEVPQNGNVSNQDFKQCNTQPCQAPPPPPPPPPPDRCCQCRMKDNEQVKSPHIQKTSLCCTCDCPIIIDTTGNGFDLTSAAGGVTFDMSGTASPVQMSWTDPNSGNAFLCLPDPNGACDDGKDLFGNFTPQPATQVPNGFLALAVYDLPVNGGNGDGIIDSRDAIFSRLRLWIDRNHDGISQPNEIYTLPSLGVYSISLNYKEDRKVDQYGNLFRYRAQINPGGPAGSVGRTVYDVFLLLGSGTITAQQSCPVPQAPRLLPEGKSRLH